MKKIWNGNFEADISDLIQIVVQELNSKIPLIRTLDSTQDQSVIGDAVHRAIHHELADMNDLFLLDKSGVFSGFDEIWICNSGDGVSEARCSSCPQLTSDGFDFCEKENIPAEMLDLLERDVVVCVLGTGVGVNYGTTHKSVATGLSELRIKYLGM